MYEVGSYVPSIHPHHYKCPNFVPFYGWVFHCILYIVYFIVYAGSCCISQGAQLGSL